MFHLKICWKSLAIHRISDKRSIGNALARSLLRIRPAAGEPGGLVQLEVLYVQGGWTRNFFQVSTVSLFFLVSNIFHFSSPSLGKGFPIWRAYFSKGAGSTTKLGIILYWFQWLWNWEECITIYRSSDPEGIEDEHFRIGSLRQLIYWSSGSLWLLARGANAFETCSVSAPEILLGCGMDVVMGNVNEGMHQIAMKCCCFNESPNWPFRFLWVKVGYCIRRAHS